VGPGGKSNDLSESANPSIQEERGEDMVSGSCLDYEECEECEGDELGEDPREVAGTRARTS
jgi:hypothetical protein